MPFNRSWRVLRPVLFVITLLAVGAAGLNPTASAANTGSIVPKDTVVVGNLSRNTTFDFQIEAILGGTPFFFSVHCGQTTLAGKTPAAAGDLKIPLQSETFAGCKVPRTRPPSGGKVYVTTSGTWNLTLGTPASTPILATLQIAHFSARIPFFGDCRYRISGNLGGIYNNDGVLNLDGGARYTETSACPPAYPSGQQVMSMSGRFVFDPVFKEKP